MFDILKQKVNLFLEKNGLNEKHMDFSKKDWYSKGFWEGYIEGLAIAEKKIKSVRKDKGGQQC